VLEDYLRAGSDDLPLLREALRGKVRKRAAEDAEARRLHGAAAADAQYKAQYRHKKETQANPYTRDPVLSGPSADAAVMVRNR
jgi:hypothetical protein